MSRKSIRISCLGVPSDYRIGLVPLIIKSLGYQINWVAPSRADLLVYGSFYDLNAPRLRWLPRSWRQEAVAIVDVIEKQLAKRGIPPLTLFHTAENLRHDHIKTDYAISHDLNVSSENHFRLPYWMEMIDWSHEGIVGNMNPRYGELLKLERLQAPLGRQFLDRAQKAVLITSHLREPKASCYTTLQKFMPVDGMGPYFDHEIKDHHSSHFLKKDVLKGYAFNLCPENGLYPGYVTEKIPEAFSAGCLPIAFVDETVRIDFNENAFINLHNFNNSKALSNIIDHDIFNNKIALEPLLLSRPSLLSLRRFLSRILQNI